MTLRCIERTRVSPFLTPRNIHGFLLLKICHQDTLKEMQLLNKLSNILVKSAFKLLILYCIIFSGEISI